MPRFLLDFTRSSRADAASVALPDGDLEYQLRGNRQSRPDLTELRWSTRLHEQLDALRGHTEGAVGESAARVGRVLADFVAVPQWASTAREITEAAGRERVTLTVRSNASELYLLPWELLPIEPVAHAGFLPNLLLRYEWPDSRSAPRLPGLSQTRRGRVVFAWSAAGGRVDAARHVRLMERALDDAGPSFDERDRALDVIEGATCASLKACLDRARAAGEPVAVLHLLCHGGVDDAGTFGLVLGASDDPEARDLVSPSRVQQLLAPFAGLVRLVVISACDGGNAGPVGHQLGSVAQELHRAGFPAVIASRFPLSWDGAWLLADALYDALLRGLGTLEDALLAARSKLSQRGTYDWASVQLYAREADGDATPVFNVRPYRGLAAFAPEHARFFCGRDAEIDELVRELDLLLERGTRRIMVVAGASGTGKSSLVMAGAVSRWTREAPPGRFRYVLVRPGDAPEAALDAIDAQRDLAAACERFLIVVDQFEELFTHNDTKAATSFVRALWQKATEPGTRVCVVVTVRVDFLGACSAIVLDEEGLRLDKIACDPAHQVLVAQMTPAQLRDAVEGPARAAGLSLEPGLAELVVRDVEAEPGALPLMSHALYLLWLRRAGSTLTRDAYKAIGSVQGALDAHAEEQLAALRDDAERDVARRLLLRLVNPGAAGTPDTRRRRDVDALRPADELGRERFERVLRRLVDARLLVTGAGVAGAQTVEIAHEALLRSWRRFKDWVNGERARLAQLDQLDVWVADWQKNRDALLAGSRLGYAEQVAAELGGDVGVEARRLLDESRAALAAQRERAARRQRRLRLTTAAVIAVLAGLAAFALIQWRTARGRTAEARAAEHAASVAAREAAASAKEAARSDVASRAAELRARADAPGFELENLADALELQVQSARRMGRDPVPLGVDGALAQATLTALARLPLRGHRGAVRRVRFSRDGAWIVTSSADGSARIWSARDGTTRAWLQHGGDVRDVSVSPDGSRVVTVPQRGSARLWDPLDGRALATLGDAADAASEPGAVAFSPDSGRAATAASGRVRVWDARSGSPLVSAVGDVGTVVGMAFSSDGQSLAAASTDGLIRVWDAQGRSLATLGARGADVQSASFSSDGERVAIVHGDHSLRVWSLRARRMLYALRGHTEEVRDARFSPDGTRIVTASSDDSARLWDARDGRALFVLQGHRGVVQVAVFSPDGARVLTASTDQSARVWSAQRGTLLMTLEGHAGSVVDASFSPDGQRVVTASADGTARIWSLDASTALVTRLAHANPVHSAEFSPDGARVVTTSGDAQATTAQARLWRVTDGVSAGALDVWRLADRASFSPDGASVIVTAQDVNAQLWSDLDSTRSTPLGHGRSVVGVCPSSDGAVVVTDARFSRDGTRVVTSSSDCTARLWDARSGAASSVLAGHVGTVARAAFSPDGTRVVTASYDRTARLWDARSGATQATLTGHRGRVVDAVFSPDGARVVTASYDFTARVWDARDGAVRATLAGHTGMVFRARFSPDGAAVVTASDDNTARVWRLSGDPSVALLRGHLGSVREARFSPDRARVVTASTDGTARLWSANGELLTVLRGHAGGVDDAMFSEDGRRVVTASADRTARVWNLDPSEVASVACGILRGGELWVERAALRAACANARPPSGAR